MGSVALPDLELFASNALRASGATREESERVAKILVWADATGRTEQGVERLPILCQRISKNLMVSPAQSHWLERSGSIAQLDAGNAIGHIAAEDAALKAISLATAQGVGVVTVADSNYFGAAGYYASLIANHGLIGMVMSNSFPKVAAPGGARPVLGTNPFSFSAPVAGTMPILLDMATASLAGSEIRRRIREGLELEPGTAVDSEGQPTLDPASVAEGALLAFGGAKGFGLSLLVEVFAGVLSGGAISKEVKSFYGEWGEPNRSSHFILALEPEKVLGGVGFENRMSSLKELIEGSGSDVRLPGAQSWARYRRATERGVDTGDIPVDTLVELASSLGVGADTLRT